MNPDHTPYRTITCKEGESALDRLISIIAKCDPLMEHFHMVVVRKAAEDCSAAPADYDSECIPGPNLLHGRNDVHPVLIRAYDSSNAGDLNFLIAESYVGGSLAEDKTSPEAFTITVTFVPNSVSLYPKCPIQASVTVFVASGKYLYCYRKEDVARIHDMLPPDYVPFQNATRINSFELFPEYFNAPRWTLGRALPFDPPFPPKPHNSDALMDQIKTGRLTLICRPEIVFTEQAFNKMTAKVLDLFTSWLTMKAEHIAYFQRNKVHMPIGRTQHQLMNRFATLRVWMEQERFAPFMTRPFPYASTFGDILTNNIAYVEGKLFEKQLLASFSFLKEKEELESYVANCAQLVGRPRQRHYCWNFGQEVRRVILESMEETFLETKPDEQTARELDTILNEGALLAALLHYYGEMQCETIPEIYRDHTDYLEI